MNHITGNSSQQILVIADTEVRQEAGGRFCLNDLHRAAGEENRHRPKYWAENQQTQELIAEIEKGGKSPILSKQGLGTFVCKELVYAYAMWISPSFNLKVIRAYDELQSQPSSDPMQALSDPATMRSLLLDYSEKMLALESTIQEQAPKVTAFDSISASDETLTITQAAKVLGVKRDYLTKYMAAKGWIYRQNKSWVAYKPQIAAGRLVYKEAKYTDDNTGMLVHKPYCHLTQKGVTKLAMLLQEGPL